MVNLFGLGGFLQLHNTVLNPCASEIFVAQGVGVESPSQPVMTFFPVSESSYRLIRFLLHSSVVKDDKEVGKFSY